MGADRMQMGMLLQRCAARPGLAAPGPDRSFAAFGCDRCARSEAGEGDLIGLRADEALPGQEDGSSVPAMNHTRAVARKSHHVGRLLPQVVRPRRGGRAHNSPVTDEPRRGM